MKPIYLHFCATLPGWIARNNPQSHKSCKKVEIFVSGLSEQLQHDDLVRADPAWHRERLRGGFRERQPHTAQRGAERAARTAQRDGAHGSRRAPPLKAPSGNHALWAISRNSA